MTKDGFLRGAMILTIAGVVVKIIGAVNRILLSRFLGGEGIGLYQMAYPIYTLAISIATAGLPVAISIMIAEKLANKDAKGASRVFNISMGVLAMTGLVFSFLLFFSAQWFIDAGWIRDPRAYYAISALSPAIFVVTLLSCFRGYFQGFQYMMPTGVSQIFEQLFRVVTMLAFAVLLMPKGLEYAAAGATFGALPGALAGLLILLYFYYKQRHVRAQYLREQDDSIEQESLPSIVKRLIILAIPVSMANIMLPVVSSIDLFIVPKRLEVAGFTVEQATTLFGYLTGMATSLVNLPTILTASLAASLVPAVSEAFTLNNKAQILSRTEVAMRISNLITIPSFLGMCVLATPISQMLYATPHAGSSIAIMSFGVFLLGVQQVTTGILQGMGHTALPMINLVISAIAKVGLSWWLTAIPWLGIEGAAWATNVDFGLAALLNLIFVYRYVKYTMDLKSLVKIYLAAGIMGAVAYGTYTVLVGSTGNTIAVGSAILLAMVVYAAGLAIVGEVKKEDLYRLPIVGAKFSPKEK